MRLLAEAANLSANASCSSLTEGYPVTSAWLGLAGGNGLGRTSSGPIRQALARMSARPWRVRFLVSATSRPTFQISCWEQSRCRFTDSTTCLYGMNSLGFTELSVLRYSLPLTMNRASCSSSSTGGISFASIIRCRLARSKREASWAFRRRTDTSLAGLRRLSMPPSARFD